MNKTNSRIENDLVNVTETLFTVLGYNISSNELRNVLLKNPSFPNIGAFTDLLNSFGIANKIGRTNIGQITQLEPYFVVQLLNDGLAIVSEMGDQSIKYFTTENGWVVRSINDFNQQWNGIVVLFDTSKPKDIKTSTIFKNLLEKLQLPIIALVYFCFSLFLILSEPSLNSFFLITKPLGIIVCAYLLYLDISKRTSDKFCKIGKNVDCNHVLNSKASKVIWGISLSDLGLIYFVSTYLIVLLSLFNPSMKAQMDIVFLLGIVSLPFILFSLFHQIKLGTWCTMCLVILFLILVEGVLSLLLIEKIGYTVMLLPILLFLFISVTILLLWSYLKKKIQNYYGYKSVFYPYHRLKNRKDIFQLLIEKEGSVDFSNLQNILSFGNKESTNTITIVINPYCEFCGNEFNDVLAVLPYGNLNFSMILSKSKDDEITYMLIELYYISEEQYFLEAVQSWFKTKNKSVFKTQHDIEITKRAQEVLGEHSLWCLENKVITTPKVYFNNYKLPPSYMISDLRKMV